MAFPNGVASCQGGLSKGVPLYVIKIWHNYMTFKILTIILLIYAVWLHVVIPKKLCILRQEVNVLIRSCFLYATTFNSSVLCLLHGSGIWFLWHWNGHLWTQVMPNFNDRLVLFVYTLTWRLSCPVYVAWCYS